MATHIVIETEAYNEVTMKDSRRVEIATLDSGQILFRRVWPQSPSSNQCWMGRFKDDIPETVRPESRRTLTVGDVIQVKNI